MAKINRNELTKEMIEKAMQCKTADELMALAKAEGYDMTKDEAEAYMAEFQKRRAASAIWRTAPSTRWPTEFIKLIGRGKA